MLRRIWRKTGGLFIADAPVVLAVCVAVGGAMLAAHVPDLAWARPWVPLWLLAVPAAAFTASLAGSVNSGRGER